MTCIEKYMMEHPDENRDKVVKYCCPNLAGGIDIEDPENCKVEDSNICAMCWNREVPEAVPVVEDSGNQEKIIFGYYHPSDCATCENCEVPETEKPYDLRAALKTAAQNAAQAKSAVVNTTFTIKDSGNRTEFPSGAVRDIQEGKGRMDLLPWAAIMEVSKHCENGAAKYGEHNVDKGVPTSSLCNSAARHLAKFIDGWDDEPHLLAATWNLLWAVQMELKHPELCDVPWEGK